MKKTSKKGIVKKSKIVLTILIIAIVLILLINIFIILSPKSNITNYINHLFSDINEKINNTNEENIQSILDKGTLVFNTNTNEYNKLQDYNIIYDIEYDRKNKASLFDLKFGDSEESFSGKLLVNNNDIYLNFPDLISRMISIPIEKDNTNIENNDLYYLEKMVEKFNIIYNINNDDLLYLSKTIENIIVDKINNSNNFKKSFEDFNIKTTYKMNNNDINDIINKINSDTKSNNILKNNLNISLKKVSDKKYIDLVIYRNLFGVINGITLKNDDFTFNYRNSKMNLLIDNKEVFNLYFKNSGYSGTITYKSTKINYIITNSDLDNGISSNGSIKINISSSEYIMIDFSNSISTNVRLNEIDISNSININELGDNDKKILDDSFSLISELVNK